ncbi:hypothetical protein [Pseudomonas sp.]|uniref:hypothetical protein n=1 Tax=Pseudomonas sp. TaxID=306 RepID=UPI00262973BA|nr:hypothetical protein [Pseudomonas sp.]
MFSPSRRRLSSQFAQIPNDVLRPRGDLSARALGVLCHMLSHSDGFEISRASLDDQFTEGRDALDTALRELREAGYVRAVRTQGDGGRFTGATYLVFDERGGAEADPEPDAGNHSPGFQGDGVRKTTALENHSPGNPHPHIRTPMPIEHQVKNISNNTSDSTFETFWSIYPRRVGKGAAVKAFEKAARGTDPIVINAAVLDHAAAWRAAGTEPRHIPHPATWLNQQRWLDEHLPEPARAQLSAADQMARDLISGQNHDWGANAIGQ